MSDDLLDLLLHEWSIIAQHDGGYVLGRCRVCGFEELVDVGGDGKVTPCASRFS